MPGLLTPAGVEAGRVPHPLLEQRKESLQNACARATLTHFSAAGVGSPVCGSSR